MQVEETSFQQFFPRRVTRFRVLQCTIEEVVIFVKLVWRGKHVVVYCVAGGQPIWRDSLEFLGL